jgi:hypothetical protein
MPIWLHQLEMIPPKQCRTTKIHCYKFNLSLLGAWQGENIQLGLNSTQPSISL